MLNSTSRISSHVTVGAVAVDPQVVTVWDCLKQYLAHHGVSMEYTLFSTYERQVEALFLGAFDIAWNSPLAWLQSKGIAHRLGLDVHALAMRDTDQDRRSVICVRNHGDVHKLADLRGQRIGVGAHDSPQGTLIPLNELMSMGLGLDAFRLIYHDVLVGKHGEHNGGERAAARALLLDQVDAACMLEANYQAFCREGVIRPGQVRVLHRTTNFDQCNFTVINKTHPGANHFVEVLLNMTNDTPETKRLFALEGLSAWKLGRASGYHPLESAVTRLSYLDEWLDTAVARIRGQLALGASTPLMASA